ncbi:MAG: membrane-binding protein, partial [Bacteroidota bacterium]
STEKEKLPTTNPMETSVEIPDITVNKSLVDYKNQISLWTLNDQPYSGYMVSYYPDGRLKEKTGILNGRKQNQSTQWFPDGHLKQVANYHRGKLHGEKKRWTSNANHALVAEFNYINGKAHGEQTQWYVTGELYKKLNLNMGKEEGLQRAFRKNGALYANYEARNGRIFGLKKAALCYGLEDENVKYEK